MAALTEARDTLELKVNSLHYTYARTVASNATVYAGSLAAQNAAGAAVPAADAAGLVVLGRAENTGAGGATINIRTGVYIFANGASAEALTTADIGAVCYALDDQTVGKAGGTNKIKAGTVLEVTADGVIVKIG